MPGFKTAKTRILFSILLSAFATSLSSASAFAATIPGNWGTGDCGGREYCYNNSVWVYYEFTKAGRDTSLGNLAVPNNPRMNQARWSEYNTYVPAKCRTENKYGAFYLLTRYETIHPGGVSTPSGYAGTILPLSHVKNAKLKKNGKTEKWNGSNPTSTYVYSKKIPGPYVDKTWTPKVSKSKARYVSFTEAYNAFKEMEKNDPDAIKDSSGKAHKWNASSNLAGFCYPKDGAGNKASEFHTQSWVSYKDDKNASKESSPKVDDSADTPKVKVRQNSTKKVTFKHELAAYDRSKFSSDDVKTTYTISQSGVSATKKTGTISTKTSTWKTGTHHFSSQKVINFSAEVSIPVTDSTVTVCQTISYTPTKFKVDNKGKITYTKKKRSSKACIKLEPTPFLVDWCTDIIPTAKTQNYGNTIVKTQAVNYSKTPTTQADSKAGGWKTTVYARPGDQVQFRHIWCYGAQAVTYSTESKPSPRKMPPESIVPPNTFRISASPSNDYLFDRKNSIFADGSISFKGKQSATNRVNSAADDKDVSQYEMVVFSPRYVGAKKNYSENTYNCVKYGAYGAAFDRYTYQIPGFGGADNDQNGVPDTSPITNCRSQNIAHAADSVSWGDAGKKITQTATYNKVQAWVNKYETYYGSCGCATNRPSRNERLDSYPSPEERDILKENYGANGWGHREHTCRQSGTCCSGCCGQYCSCCSHPPTYSTKVNKKWYPVSSSYPTITTSASAIIPYNFRTEAESSIIGGDDEGVVYAGEDVGARFTVDVVKRLNSLVNSESYRTVTPNDTQIQAVAFTINSRVALNETTEDILSGTSLSSTHPCAYLLSRFGTSSGLLCNQLDVSNGPLNKEGDLEDANIEDEEQHEYAKEIDDIVPDVESGSKYCVAVGINHTDSHNLPDTLNLAQADGANSYAVSNTSRTGASPNWRISNISCRTVAKKPNFQIWGNAYTKGHITTSLSPKHAGVALSGNTPEKIFGSWSEVATIANGTVEGFASGAALGYSRDGGGADPSRVSKKYCNLTKLTISNDLEYCESDEAGHAGITNVDTASLLNQVRSRYTAARDRLHSGLLQTVSNNGAQYTYYDSDIELPFIRQYAGVRVIEVNGTLTITGDICSGEGTCGTSGNKLVLNQRNTTSYDKIENLPQVIIIAKNIVIRPNVTQIDAWLFAEGTGTGIIGGDINTCSDGHLSISTCSNTLMFNGPVFAKTLTLNRTAGAYPGRNKIGPALYNADLASDLATGGRQLENSGAVRNDSPGYGSLTPAEIFNLRPDVYLWSYNQANRLTQATVVYMRELAPRY